MMIIISNILSHPHRQTVLKDIRQFQVHEAFTLIK